MNEKRSGLTSIRVWWLAICGGAFLMAFIAGVTFMPGTMLNGRNLRNILTTCGSTLLIAAAIYIPFARGQLDLSVLGVGSFCAMLIGVFCNYLGMPGIVAALIALFIGAIIGLLNGLIAMVFRRKNPIFLAAATACIGIFYRYIAMSISDGSPIRIPGFMSSGNILLFLLPVMLLTGIFALLSFTKGGARDFNGIYEKESDCSRCTIVSFLLSGALSGLAAALTASRVGAVMPTMFNFNPSYILPLAIAGVAIPNVKKNKTGAFLGYLSLIPAALAATCMQNILNRIGVNTYINYIVFAFFSAIFIILNAILGSKASKIEYSPVKSAPMQQVAYAAPPAHAPGYSPYAALEEITRMYRSGEISEREYIMRKNEILSRM